MKNKENDYYTIAGRARTLQERISCPVKAGSPVDDPEGWIQEWECSVTDAAHEFRDRIEREGLSESDCLEALRFHGWPKDESLPSWVSTLDSLINHITEYELIWEGDHSSRPFGHILEPIVDYAVSQLTPDLQNNFSTNAIHGIEQSLFDRLEVYLPHPLFLEFKTSGMSYKEFVVDFCSRQALSFFKEYSFLARLLSCLVENWIESINEFVRRLNSDFRLLGDEFGSGNLGQIVSIQSLGEPHNFGRSVFQIQFSSDVTVAYKPRNVGVEVAMQDVLNWASSNIETLDYLNVDYLDQETYGWVEWVEFEPCQKESEIRDFYYRAGGLIAILYVWGFSDGHLENFVANADRIALIDAETAVQPGLDHDLVSVIDNLQQFSWNTVVRTGLLPVSSDTTGMTDYSGLGANKAESTDVKTRKFIDVNTDQMDLTYVDSVSITGQNLPVIDGEVQYASDYCTDIVAGFRDTYKYILNNKKEAKGLNKGFSGLYSRFIYRNTGLYDKLHMLLSTPSYQRSGLAFGCKVEELASVYVPEQVGEDIHWEIFEAEIVAISDGDIPKFVAHTEERALYIRGEKIPEFFNQTSTNKLEQRVDDLSEFDLGEQVRYIRWAFGKYPREPDVPVNENSYDNRKSDRYITSLYNRIEYGSADTVSSGKTWFLRQLDPEGGLDLKLVDEGLYSGRVGISLFFASIAHSSEMFSSINRRLVLERIERVLDPVLSKIDECEIDDWGLGINQGIGGIIYGLLKIGLLTGESEYINAAKRAGGSVAESSIRTDNKFDVLDGSAGLILGLHSLFTHTGKQCFLSKATIAGNHLLEQAVTTDAGAYWESEAIGRPLTGYSHGASGVALSLMRLYDSTSQVDFRDMALAGIEYERQFFDLEHGNWRDLREGGQLYKDAWCHGRTGIGLSRLAMLETLDDTSIRSDLDRAITGAVSGGLLEYDHVCCGNMSKVEFFHELNSRTSGEYEEELLTHLSPVLARADANGRFQTNWGAKGWCTPGFFDGVSGIGYSLLRLKNAELPSVLLFE